MDDGSEPLDGEGATLQTSAEKVRRTHEIVLISEKEIYEMREAIQQTQEMIAKTRKLIERS